MRRLAVGTACAAALALALAAGAWFWFSDAFYRPGPLARDLDQVIPKGAGVDLISRLLHDRDIISIGHTTIAFSMDDKPDAVRIREQLRKRGEERLTTMLPDEPPKT